MTALLVIIYIAFISLGLPDSIFGKCLARNQVRIIGSREPRGLPGHDHQCRNSGFQPVQQPRGLPVSERPR